MKMVSAHIMATKTGICITAKTWEIYFNNVVKM